MRARVSARAGELMMASALLSTGVFFVWQSALLPFGNVGLPGPGFFPFVLGIVLGLVALAIVIRTIIQWRGAPPPRRALRALLMWRGATFLGGPVVRFARKGDAPISLGNRDVLVVFAALVGVGLFFERLGTYVTLGLFTATLLLLVARTSPWRAVLGACLGMVAVWLFFRVLLGVQLPSGPF